jgi:murein DD-endopeptidase MepM/ murein hydrolase activator NlpD
MVGRGHKSQGRESFSGRSSTRGAVLVLLVSVAFLSGIGASPGADSVQLAVAHPHASSGSSEASTLQVVRAKAPPPGLLSDGDEVGFEARGEVIAEFPPVDIDELPLHDDSPKLLSYQRKRELRVSQGLIVVTKGSLTSGQCLSVALRRQGVSASTVGLVAREMRAVFNFRGSQPGDRYRLVQDPEGNVSDFRYSSSPEDSLHLYWNGEGYVVRRERSELEPRLASLLGEVGTSLYQAVRDLGEKPQLANAFADIFAWDIDFTRNVKPGDSFHILYEKLYRTDDDGLEVYERPGHILAARYSGFAGEYTAVYYEKEGGPGSYFRPDGSGVERRFLLAPVQYGRISSGFTRSRHHPILNVSRPHPGVDYAAAEGTPVWSVANGEVIFRDRAGASGNLVKIRHAGGYVSHYAHLSRFAEGLAIGQRVEQKTVIGYVGHTGLATGPHVCFRITRNGRYVDPMSIDSPAAAPVVASHRGEFARIRDTLLADFVARALPASDEAL